MSDPELEPTEPTEPTEPVVDDDPDQDEEAELEEPAEPSEADAAASAASEREAELAAERQQAEQQEARDDADVERKNKALLRASDNYAKKIIDTLGPDLDGAVPCPLCADFFPGFRFPIMPPAENMPRIREMIGLEPGDNLPKDGYSRACDKCDGWGFTDSGSRVPGQAKLTCYDCKGRGWVPVGSERASGSVTADDGGNVVPMPVLQDNPSNDPPEVERLKQLGYVVVAPIQPLEAPNV